MSVGENIKALRIKLGLTQTELAEKIPVDQTMISQIERGTKLPNILLGKQIADALGVGLETLVQ